jgi:hypothetical protein
MSGSGPPYLSHTAVTHLCIGCTFRGVIWSSTQSVLGKSLVFCSVSQSKSRAPYLDEHLIITIPILISPTALCAQLLS